MTHRMRTALIGAALLLDFRAQASPPAHELVFDLKAVIAEARDGDVIIVPPGMHLGPFVVDASIELRGNGAATLDGGGEGDVLTINAPSTTVRGFTIRNTGKSLDRENAGITGLAESLLIEDNILEDVLFGIYLRDASGSVIRGNTIGGKNLEVQRRGDGVRIWQSHDVLIEDNVVRNSRDVVIWYSDNVALRNNQISHGRYGMHFMYSSGTVIEGNRLEHNSVGAFLMYSKKLTLRRNIFAHNRGPSGFGVGLKDMDGVDAKENLFISNRIGLSFDNSPSSMLLHDTYERNTFAYNDIGVAFLPAVKRNTFVNNAFIENIQQIAVLGGGQFKDNQFSKNGRGNFWSDYQGFDLDGDGIGEIAYRSDDLFEDLMDREPKLRLFLHSPAQQAIELASRAFPVVAPTPKLTDDAPLLEPHVPEVTYSGERNSGPMWWTCALLAAAAGAGLIAARPQHAPQKAWSMS